MARVAIIGAGQAGLLAAHDLLRHGYDVTVYSDKTPEQFLADARPTGNASRYDMALDYERQLGLAHWEREAPIANGIFATIVPAPEVQLLTTIGRMSKPSYAIDVRLQSARWMEDLEERGGRVSIENVSFERLDEIAAENDLTLVAVGKQASRLFARDDRRSTYPEPQRNVALVNLTGVSQSVPYAAAQDLFPIKVNIYPEWGEAFWIPWFSKDGLHCRSLVFSAKPGGPIDRFGSLADGAEAVATALEVIREIAPWDYDWFKDGELPDENAWLVGRVLPIVRDVVGTLPSGRQVMALGDTAQTLDPIGGQGANNGNKMARSFVESVVEAGEGPFDAEWMRGAFDRFWARHHDIDVWNNMLLDGPPPSGVDYLMAAYGATGRSDDDSPQQRLADAWAENWSDPAELTEDFFDPERVRARIAAAFGGSAEAAIMHGKLEVSRQQLRQQTGLAPKHPGPSVPPTTSF
ncbi:MAG: oxidoreductase [Actinobacteria bacterium]|nr:oxidoreductase [Actinomycetota bacterium]